MAQQMDNTIEAEIQGLEDRYRIDGMSGLTELIATRLARQQAQATSDSIYLLTTYTRKRLVGNIDNWPTQGIVDGEWITFELVIDQETNQKHPVRAKIFRLPGRYGLLVGRDIKQLTEAQRRIVQALAWGLVLMLLLAFVCGFVLSRRTVRKIERINQTTHSIMRGNLSRRVPLTKRNDDFDQVAENLNLMLDKIQSLMEDIRRVSDNIAHDLRTPLARLRLHLEEAKQQESPNSQSARRLDNSIQEADSLLSTFNALLRIARIESGQIKFGFKEIELHVLLADIAEFYEPLVEEKQQRLITSLESSLTSWGDGDLIFQAIANIIENSIKYTQPHGLISISLTQWNHAALITIADNGPGIPAAQRENVFHRFYRLDQSRSSSGSGLGLSLVSAVLSMHNGSIELQDNHPGVQTIIKLPLTVHEDRHAEPAHRKPYMQLVAVGK